MPEGLYTWGAPLSKAACLGYVQLSQKTDFGSPHSGIDDKDPSSPASDTGQARRTRGSLALRDSPVVGHNQSRAPAFRGIEPRDQQCLAATASAKVDDWVNQASPKAAPDKKTFLR